MNILIYYTHETEQYAWSYGMLNRAPEYEKLRGISRILPSQKMDGDVPGRRDPGVGTHLFGLPVILVHPDRIWPAFGSGEGVARRRRMAGRQGR